ncbi:MAG: exodeoxyribonuclease VII large subunit [Proteobacteria bacterium]|nr:exodeoxyribonuclease VII large subunit [Pseudomonadota bacterium]
MLDLVDLSEVNTALGTALSDRPFVTRGYVVEVKRVRGSCYFTLADGDAQLPSVLLKQDGVRIDFWVTVGQVMEVKGYAECFQGRWQLRLVEARLVQGDRGWAMDRRRSVRRVADVSVSCSRYCSDRHGSNE